MSDADFLSTDAILQSRGGAHPNPNLDFLTGYVPRKLKELLSLQEWLFSASPHIFAALNKLSDYSITDVVYATEAAGPKSKMKELMEETLRVKSVLKACSRDRMVYGNSFVSVYMPFTRFLACTTCRNRRNINKINYKFKYKDLSFRWSCVVCKAPNVTSITDVQDVKSQDISKINIIRWDPKQMDIDYNPITGHSVYYYNIPREVKERIQAGNKHLLNDMPKEFLLAVKENKVFKFSEGQLYHMKIDAPAGIDAQWGFPPLTSTIKQFYYTSVLRKANEAIALDHLVPFRVLHPGQSSQNGDPVQMLNMGRWTEETKENIKKWRRDPLHIMMSPVPLGVTQMGGDGRALMTLGEVEAAENNIMAAMGIPREFLFGGLSFTGSSVTLRMLENQLLNQTKDLEDLMNWIGRKVVKFLDWPEVHMNLTPFKLIDDVQQKGALLQLNQAGQVISNTTLANVFGYDIDRERKIRMQEALDEQRFQTELQYKMTQMQNTVASQARAKAQQGNAQLSYDQQAVIAAADQIAQQMLQLDPSTKRSQLESLKQEDAVMYAVVVQQLEDYTKQQNAAAKMQVAGGGGAPE